MSGIRRAWMLAAALAGTSACAAHSAPPGWVPDAAGAQSDAYGGWIQVLYQENGKSSPPPGARGGRTARSGQIPPQEEGGPAQAEGELIAASPDSLWIRTRDGASVIPTDAVVSGSLVAYESGAGTMTGTVALGTVSTISNGAFLVFTAPMWIIGGIIATRKQAKLPVVDLPAPWTDLAPFARFPQGMPPGVELRQLRPRR